MADASAPVPPAAVDALSKIIGDAPARITRVILSGLAVLAASKGFGWINPADPTLGILVNVGVTGALSGLGKLARNKGWLPAWMPL